MPVLGGMVVVMDSVDTRLAKTEADEAARAWRNHKQQCHHCSGRVARCPDGEDYAAVAARSAERARDEAAKDAEPIPGQGTLW